MITRSNQVALYSDYKPSFGRFSFFEVKDFDFDFYSTLYSQEGELDFEVAVFAEKLASYNPQALSEMKKVLWLKTQNWDSLLLERAKISGELVLSEFTKNSLVKF